MIGEDLFLIPQLEIPGDIKANESTKRSVLCISATDTMTLK